jgi:hypothetical protein
LELQLIKGLLMNPPGRLFVAASSKLARKLFTTAAACQEEPESWKMWVI